MNFIMVEITDIPGVSLEEEAVLIGKSGKEFISADDLASLVGTINYEIVTGIGSHLPRIVIQNLPSSQKMECLLEPSGLLTYEVFNDKYIQKMKTKKPLSWRL